MQGFEYAFFTDLSLRSQMVAATAMHGGFRSGTRHNGIKIKGRRIITIYAEDDDTHTNCGDNARGDDGTHAKMTGPFCTDDKGKVEDEHDAHHDAANEQDGFS